VKILVCFIAALLAAPGAPGAAALQPIDEDWLMATLREIARPES